MAINHILALVLSGVLFLRPASFGPSDRGQVFGVTKTLNASCNIWLQL
ncbi:hypothetical protein SeF6a_216 [Salmonella phage SeF6a]|nr:hypothetical protein SeF6a_216 [Salmonella phage SeF6a]